MVHTASEGSDAVEKLTALAKVQRAGDDRRLEDRLRAADAEIAQLKIAVEHRTVIGQAVGILVERFQIDSGAAFDTLKRVSQESNRKVFDIAHELCTTGHSGGL